MMFYHSVRTTENILAVDIQETTETFDDPADFAKSIFLAAGNAQRLFVQQEQGVVITIWATEKIFEL